MLKHSEIWHAIDALAAANDYSPSGLAREAGLDATTFNKSKRLSAEGKQRWPSTESVAKILDVTGASFMDFAALVHKTVLKTRIAVLPLSAGMVGGKSDAAIHIGEDGKPTGKGWGKRTITGSDDENAFGLEVTTAAVNAASSAGLRNGSLLIAAPSAKIQKDDRVVVVLANGIMQLRQVGRVVGKRYELLPLGPRQASLQAGKLTVERTNLRLIAKIVQIIE